MAGNQIDPNKRIMVVDDFERWRSVAGDSLASWGFREVRYFYDVSSALGDYSRYLPHLAFLDVNFDPSNPGLSGNMDGLYLCERLRELDNQLVIAVMSSMSEAQDLAMQKGANGFILKRNFVSDFDKFMEECSKR